MARTTERSKHLDILARGVTCPRCGAWADMPCKTPKGWDTEPHSARIDRACKLWEKSKQQLAEEQQAREIRQTAAFHAILSGLPE